MHKFPNLHALTPKGLDLFERTMLRESDEHALDVGNRDYAEPIPDTKPFVVAPFKTAREWQARFAIAWERLMRRNLQGERDSGLGFILYSLTCCRRRLTVNARFLNKQGGILVRQMTIKRRNDTWSACQPSCLLRLIQMPTI